MRSRRNFAACATPSAAARTSPASSERSFRRPAFPSRQSGPVVTVHLSNEMPRALRQAIGPRRLVHRTLRLALAGWRGLPRPNQPDRRRPGGLDARPGARPGGPRRPADRISLWGHFHVGREGAHDAARGALPLSPARLPAPRAKRSCARRSSRWLVPVSPTSLQWLSPEDGEQLLAARPEQNLIPTAIDQQLGLLIGSLGTIQTALEPVANERAAAQLPAHERVREASEGQRPRHHRTRAAGGYPRRLRAVADFSRSDAMTPEESQE